MGRGPTRHERFLCPALSLAFDRLESFVEEPHNAICSQRQEQTVLDLTALESRENRKVTLDIVKDGHRI